MVAPYEADAQMAYLALTGRVGVVVTEDSDMLCYGCPVVRVLGRWCLARGSCGAACGGGMTRWWRLQHTLQRVAKQALGRSLPCLDTHRTQVFFKMDKNGEGEEVRLHDLADARELSLVGFTHEMFQEVRPQPWGGGCFTHHTVLAGALHHPHHARVMRFCAPAPDVRHGGLRLRQGAAGRGGEEGARADQAHAVLP